jgi:hypothetical protein
MSDTIGDVGDFEEPPRHPDDIKAELAELSTKMTNDIFENEIFDEFVGKFPEEFVYQIGETIAIVLGDRAQGLRAKLIEGFDGGLEEPRDMNEEG